MPQSTSHQSVSCPVALLLAIATRLEETQALLQEALGSASLMAPTIAPTLDPIPTLDTATLTVSINGRSCFLGNTLPFWLFSRLLRRPNCYVSHTALMDEVWKGLRSPAAIRSVVRELRAKLRSAGMEEIANGIDGTVRGHYAYIRNSQ